MSLRETLQKVIRNRHSPRELAELIALCRAMAHACLDRKLAQGQIHRGIITLPIPDLAIDCIADLFSCDHSGVPVQIRAYFAGLDLEAISDKELMVSLRRLVFSKVNAGLYRTYSELDPGLGRIIRGIKLCVTPLGLFTESERFGKPLLTPALCDPLLHRPLLERDALVSLLHRCEPRKDNIPSMMSALSGALRAQCDFSRSMPLTTVALAYREYHGRLHSSFFQESNAAELMLDRDDIRLAIRRACGLVGARMRTRYVSPSGEGTQAYAAYWAVISRSLEMEFAGETDPVSLFGSLRELIPELTEETYRKLHRNPMEYLLKLVRKESRALLTKAFGLSAPGVSAGNV